MIRNHLMYLILLLNAFIVGIALSLFFVPIISCYINHNIHYFLENILWLLICVILAVLFFKFKVNQIKLLIFIVLSSLITWAILYFVDKETILTVVQTLWANCHFFYHTNENADLALFVIGGIFLAIILSQSTINFVYTKSKT